MPLEALYSLMEENFGNPIEKNILDGTDFHYTDKLVLVKKNYFQSKPNNIDESTITNDVLAFCTLVLSYAKAAIVELKPDQSPKLFISFMPRTEFNTLFQLVKPKLTGDLLLPFQYPRMLQNRSSIRRCCVGSPSHLARSTNSVQA